MANVRVAGECWEWSLGRFSAGYGAAFHEGKTWKAHRLAYLLFKGPIPPGALICHTCDNPPCIRPSHLYAGTGRTNVMDAVHRGRWNPPTGERNKMTHLTSEDVVAIRIAAADGATAPEIEASFGISQASYSRIVTGETWKGAGGPIRPPLTHAEAALRSVASQRQSPGYTDRMRAMSRRRSAGGVR